MERTKEVIDFESRFQPEAFEILAVTGANGFCGGKGRQDQFWSASVDLIAYRQGTGEICQDLHRLTVKADDDYLNALREAAGANSVIRAQVRRGTEGKRFLLVGTPQKASDPQLEEVLAERLKPVYYEDAMLGKFTLDRSVDWFERQAVWMGNQISLSFDNGSREEMGQACETARQLFANQADWDRRIRAYAAAQLLELKNDCWLDEDEPEFTDEDFISRLRLESLQVDPDGEFEFWFDDGDIFWGHSVHVCGTLEDGPNDAQMEG